MLRDAQRALAVCSGHTEDGQNKEKDTKTAEDADESGEVCAAKPAPLFSFPFGKAPCRGSISVTKSH